MANVPPVPPKSERDVGYHCRLERARAAAAVSKSRVVRLTDLFATCTFSASEWAVYFSTALLLPGIIDQENEISSR